MKATNIISCLENNPIIAAVQDNKWNEALESPAQVIFYLSAEILSIQERVASAHAKGKYVMVHIDLAEGIGKDKAGIRYLVKSGVDGVISTRSQIIRYAKEQGLVTIQRFFAVDSKGLESIEETLKNTYPHMAEIMPGVVYKAIHKFSINGIPIIAGGLIQEKHEVTNALGAGAIAISTGRKDLWYL